MAENQVTKELNQNGEMIDSGNLQGQVLIGHQSVTEVSGSIDTGTNQRDFQVQHQSVTDVVIMPGDQEQSTQQTQNTACSGFENFQSGNHRVSSSSSSSCSSSGPQQGEDQEQSTQQTENAACSRFENFQSGNQSVLSSSSSSCSSFASQEIKTNQAQAITRKRPPTIVNMSKLSTYQYCAEIKHCSKKFFHYNCSLLCKQVAQLSRRVIRLSYIAQCVCTPCLYRHISFTSFEKYS